MPILAMLPACWARAASGQAAALPRRVMKSRLSMLITPKRWESLEICATASSDHPRSNSGLNDSRCNDRMAW
jgi:hypothetical protein